MACQRESVNVDPSNDARWTAVRTWARSGPMTSVRTSGVSTGSVRSRRSGVHGSSAVQPRSDSRSCTRGLIEASACAFPSGSTARPVMSSARRRASSSSCRASGAIASRTRPGPSSRPTARMRPARLHVRTAAAVASAPNRQNQPRSPGCSCTGAPSYCHSRSTPATPPSPSTPGAPSTIVMHPIRHHRTAGPHTVFDGLSPGDHVGVEVRCSRASVLRDRGLPRCRDRQATLPVVDVATRKLTFRDGS